MTLAKDVIPALSFIRPLSYLSKEEAKHNCCGEHLTDCKKEALASLPGAEQGLGHVGPEVNSQHVKHLRELQRKLIVPPSLNAIKCPYLLS